MSAIHLPMRERVVGPDGRFTALWLSVLRQLTDLANGIDSGTLELDHMGLGTAADANHFLALPADASYGIKWGTVSLRQNTQSQITMQGSGNGNSTSWSILPTTGTAPADTITELIVGRTADQAFGGDYWRMSLTTSTSPAVDGLFLEMGGTQQSGGQMIRPWVVSIGIENPAGVFTSYEPFRFLSGSDTGNVGFGVGATSGRKVLQLEMASIGAVGMRSSHLLSWRGKANDGTERAVDFRAQGVVTSTAGAGKWVLSYELNGGGASDVFSVTSAGNVVAAGALSVQGTAAQVLSGTGTPEAAVTAAVGSIFLRTDGGAATSVYVKESGAGNTGWVAK